MAEKNLIFGKKVIFQKRKSELRIKYKKSAPELRQGHPLPPMTTEAKFFLFYCDVSNVLPLSNMT